MKVALNQVSEGVQRQPEDSLDTAGVRLEVGVGRGGVKTPQHCAVAMTAENPHSFQDLSRNWEGELLAHFHTFADKA